MDADTFRGSQPWKRLRARLLTEAKRTDAPCRICHERIWWDAPRRHALGASVDHRRPLKTLDLSTAEGRRVALDPELLRVVHVGCNAARENALRKRRGATVTAPAEVEMVEVLLPVCQGRACVCCWMGSGEPREGCSVGPPEWRPVRVPRESAPEAAR